MRENNPALSDSDPDKSNELKTEYYEQESYARNVCFINKDGLRLFLSYSHLIYGEYKPNDLTILLAFTSHTINMKGIFLELLFTRLMSHDVKQIVCVDGRYNIITEKNIAIINEIIIVADNK